MVRAYPEKSTKDRQHVVALSRGLDILHCFSGGPRHLSSAEIAARTKLSQPTAWRLCRTLIDLGFLARVSGSERLQVGLRAYQLGYTYLAGMSALRRLRPAMVALNERFPGATSLAARDGLDLVMLERLYAGSFVANRRVGQRFPIMLSSMGWAYLCGIEEKQREELLKTFRRQHGREWREVEPRFRRALLGYRRDGFVTAGGFFDPRIIGVSVPIKVAEEDDFVVLVCGGLKDHVSAQRLRALGVALRKTARTFENA